MKDSRLEVERDGGVVRVWLDRPEVRNALDTAALEALIDCFQALRTDYTARAVVLGGRGPSFCGGADRRAPPGAERLAGDSGAGPRERRQVAQLGRRALEAIESLDVPTVARLQGHAVGGGLCLALACDFRLAAESASFLVPELDLGIPLTWGATPRLIRELGPLRARELIVLCEPLDARRALEWGLVNRVVAEAELDALVDDWARRLAAKPETAMQVTGSQFRAYAAAALAGEVSEADGDWLLLGSGSAEARERFRR